MAAAAADPRAAARRLRREAYGRCLFLSFVYAVALLDLFTPFACLLACVTPSLREVILMVPDDI